MRLSIASCREKLVQSTVVVVILPQNYCNYACVPHRKTVCPRRRYTLGGQFTVNQLMFNGQCQTQSVSRFWATETAYTAIIVVLMD